MWDRGFVVWVRGLDDGEEGVVVGVGRVEVCCWDDDVVGE